MYQAKLFLGFKIIIYNRDMCVCVYFPKEHGLVFANSLFMETRT